jgi:catechol 2,3-dioxygenase-like lactoylglutathione lyase family enzyme
MSEPAIPAAAPMSNFICVTDRARAKAFYSEILGLRLKEDTPFALVYEHAGRLLRISEAPDFKPQAFTVCGWVVEDIKGVVQALAAKGVVFNRYPWMEQDALGLWQPPGSGAYVCWFNDPDGNVLSLNTP